MVRRGTWPIVLALALLGVLFLGLWHFGATEPFRRAELFLALAVLSLLAAATPRLGSPRLGVLLSGAAGVVLLAGTALASGLTLAGWMHAATGWMALFLSLRLASQGRRPVRVLVAGLILIGVLEAFYGLRQTMGDSLDHVATGTLVNRNHFAGMLNMVLALALGHLVVTVTRRRRRERRSESVARAWLLVLGASILALAALLSQSRGGALSLAAMMVLVAVLARRGRRSGGRGRSVAVAVLAVTVLALGLVFGLEEVLLDRFANVSSEGERGVLYRDTLKLVADHPLAGIGPGTYRFRFRPYQSTGLSVRFDHAHNDYLETAAEWGIPAALLFWGFVAWRFLAAARAALAERETWRRGLALGSAAAIFTILVHSMVDFNLQIPANLTLLAVVLGLAWSLELKAKDEEDESGAGRRRRAGDVLVRLLLALALAAAAWRVAAHLDALRLASTGRLADLAAAAERDPANPEHAYRLGLVYRDVLAVRDLAEARGHLERAVELNPYSWRYRLELGRTYEISGMEEAAEASFQAAVARNPKSGLYRFRLADFYVRRGDLTKALGELEQAVELDPTLVERGLVLLLRSGASREAIEALWPSRREEQLRFLRLLASREPDTAAALLDDLWPRLLGAPSPPTPDEGLFYLEHLERGGRFTELRAQWIALARANGHEDPDFAAHRNEVWNGEFELPLAGGPLGWRLAAGDAFTAVREVDGTTGAHALRMDFPGEENIDFQGLRQRLRLAAGRAYRFSFAGRSRDLTTEQGIFFQVLDREHRVILETPPILGTTPWAQYSGTFTLPAGSEELTLLLRRRPSRRIDNRLAGSVWLDSVRLTAEAADAP